MVNISQSLGIMIPFLCLERRDHTVLWLRKEVIGKTVRASGKRTYGFLAVKLFRSSDHTPIPSQIAPKSCYRRQRD